MKTLFLLFINKMESKFLEDNPASLKTRLIFQIRPVLSLELLSESSGTTDLIYHICIDQQSDK